jgi:hypothetical protein
MSRQKSSPIFFFFCLQLLLLSPRVLGGFMRNVYLAIFFLIVATAAQAQDFTPTFTWTDASINNAGLASSVHYKNSTESETQSNRKPSNGGIVADPKFATSTYSFLTSQQRRKKNLANFVAKTRGSNPAQADKMEQLFANGDIIDQIDEAMQGKGLSASNSADAYAVWWVSAWQAANGDTRDIGGATYRAVSAQAARGFAASAQFANATDAQKQEMAEAMLVQAALIDASKDAYAGDPAMMQKLADAVRQGAKKSGLDLDTMMLTEDGFVPIKGRKTDVAR